MTRQEFITQANAKPPTTQRWFAFAMIFVTIAGVLGLAWAEAHKATLPAKSFDQMFAAGFIAWLVIMAAGTIPVIRWGLRRAPRLV